MAELKIISYNVNGVRAALKKGLAEWLKEMDADVVCLQELL
jgi:exodeoxyribonuclease-3